MSGQDTHFYPAGKFVPGLGRQVRIVEDELHPDLLERIEALEAKVEALESDSDD